MTLYRFVVTVLRVVSVHILASCSLISVGDEGCSLSLCMAFLHNIIFMHCVVVVVVVICNSDLYSTFRVTCILNIN